MINWNKLNDFFSFLVTPKTHLGLFFEKKYN